MHACEAVPLATVSSNFCGHFMHKQFCKMPHPCVRSSSPPCTSFSKPGHNSKIRSRSYGCARVSENICSINECSGYPSRAVLAARSMRLGLAMHGVWPMAGPGREGVCAEHGGGGNGHGWGSEPSQLLARAEQGVTMVRAGGGLVPIKGSEPP